MKKIIRLTESDLNRIVKESVDRTINEAGFWNNVQGAVQGAYNGYKTNKAINGMDASSNQMISQGMNVGKYRQAFTSMTKSLNQLSQTAQFYAQQINDYYNNGDTKKAYMLKGYMSQLETIMKQIRQYYQQAFPSNNEF